MKIFQYVTAKKQATRWIAAERLSIADAEGRRRGWLPHGGQVGPISWLPREPTDSELRQAGVDVIVRGIR